jgi:hypothetical protein
MGAGDSERCMLIFASWRNWRNSGQMLGGQQIAGRGPIAPSPMAKACFHDLLSPSLPPPPAGGRIFRQTGAPEHRVISPACAACGCVPVCSGRNFAKSFAKRCHAAPPRLGNDSWHTHDFSMKVPGGLLPPDSAHGACARVGSDFFPRDKRPRQFGPTPRSKHARIARTMLLACPRGARARGCGAAP